VWNALDYPALVFPVTTVDPTLDVKKPSREFSGEADREVHEMCE
jgi:amidase